MTIASLSTKKSQENWLLLHVWQILNRAEHLKRTLQNQEYRSTLQTSVLVIQSSSDAQRHVVQPSASKANISLTHQIAHTSLHVYLTLVKSTTNAQYISLERSDYNTTTAFVRQGRTRAVDIVILWLQQAIIMNHIQWNRFIVRKMAYINNSIYRQQIN